MSTRISNESGSNEKQVVDQQQELRFFSPLFVSYLDSYANISSDGLMSMMNMQFMCSSVMLFTDDVYAPSIDVQQRIVETVLVHWPRDEGTQHSFEDHVSMRSIERESRAKKKRQRHEEVGEELTVHHYNDTSEQKALEMLRATLDNCVLRLHSPTRIGLSKIFIPEAEQLLTLVSMSSERAEVALLLDYYARLFSMDLEQCLRSSTRTDDDDDDDVDKFRNQTLLGGYASRRLKRRGQFLCKLYIGLLDTMSCVRKNGLSSVKPAGTMGAYVHQIPTNCALLFGMLNIVSAEMPHEVNSSLSELPLADRLFLLGVLMDQARRLDLWKPLDTMIHKTMMSHFTHERKTRSRARQEEPTEFMFMYNPRGDRKDRVEEYEYLITLIACSLQCLFKDLKDSSEEDLSSLKDRLRTSFTTFKSRVPKVEISSSPIWKIQESIIEHLLIE